MFRFIGFLTFLAFASSCYVNVPEESLPASEEIDIRSVFGDLFDKAREEQGIKKEDAPCRPDFFRDLEDFPCDFEKSEKLCGWKLSNGTSAVFKIRDKPVGNRVTGIRKAGRGNGFLAAEIAANESTSIEIEVALAREYLTTFYYYESTLGFVLSGCCDSIAICPFQTDIVVAPEDRAWLVGQFTCPAGTKTVLFDCTNYGTNVGVCGLDTIRLRLPAEDAEKNSTAVCP